jgi:hypothetical protein
MGVRTWLRQHFVTADAVYGLILYSALVGGVSDDDSNALEVLLISAVSLVIFWGAHVFAGTIANHGVKDGAEVRLGAAVRNAVAHSSGMLWAAILPSVALLLGVFPVLSTDDAVTIAMLIAMLQLGVLGYQAFAQRRSSIPVRILGGLGTALFGLLMILLNIAVH